MMAASPGSTEIWEIFNRNEYKQGFKILQEFWDAGWEVLVPTVIKALSSSSKSDSGHAKSSSDFVSSCSHCYAKQGIGLGSQKVGVMGLGNGKET